MGDTSKKAETSRPRSGSRKKSASRKRSGSRKRSASRRSASKPKGKNRSPSRSRSKKKSKSRQRSASRKRSTSRRKQKESRSRSRSTKLNANMPHNSAPSNPSTNLEDRTLNVAEVLERSALQSGEPIWQAEIVVPQGGSTNHQGRPRVFTIRGPPRKTRESAESDAKRLTESAGD